MNTNGSTNGIAPDELTMLRQRITKLEQQLLSQQAEAAQQSAELLTLQALVENAPDGIGFATLDGTVLYVNHAFGAMTGHGETAVGSPFFAFFSREGLDYMQREVLPQIEANGRWQGLIPYQRPSGAEWVAQASTYIVQNQQGAPLGQAIILRDATEQLIASETTRKQTEALRAANYRLERSFANTPLATIEWGCDGAIKSWNLSAQRIFGWAADEMIGTHILARIVPHIAAEQVQSVVDTLLSGQVANSRNANITKDGREITCHWYNSVLEDADGQVIGVLSQTEDITELVRNEQDRMALQEQVIAAQQAALRELSTPIIPLTDHVVAMPLIGTIDSTRAQQVIETLLEGVASTRATTAILDITGVQVVDTQVANALLRAAQAVKLLGAQVVLTGIRPEVAQTLVGLGLDLSTIVTRSSLQSGISFALAGKSIGEQGNGARAGHR